MYNEIVDKLKDKKICILGFGKEGKSTYNFIRRHLKSKLLTIIDKKNVFDDLNDNNVNIIYGDDYLESLEQFDLIIKTPGITLNDRDITQIKNKITSQLELILEVYKNNTIGITGTKGKSTTSSLIYKILKDQNKDVYLLGNIGNPMFDNIEKFNENTYLVIEMSAHQLEYVEVSPHIGCVLNLFEDHLDHAGTKEHYHQNKMNMFKYQTEEDFAIYSSDCEDLVQQINKNKYLSKLCSVTLNSENNNGIYIKEDKIILNNRVLCDKNIKTDLIGLHNLSNILFCLLICDILNIIVDEAIVSISNFKPLEHRLELVGVYNDIIYYNDSISTIPEATITAIETLKKVDTLILGGKDRGIDYSKLISYLCNSDIKNLICMPATGYKIGKKIEELVNNKNIYYIELLKDAVEKAKEITAKNKICLMSPAASSYEYFKNFEEKGKKFKEYVKENNKNIL